MALPPSSSRRRRATRPVLYLAAALSTVSLVALLFWFRRDVFARQRLPVDSDFGHATATSSYIYFHKPSLPPTDGHRPVQTPAADDFVPPPPAHPNMTQPLVVLPQGAYAGTTLLATPARPKALDAWRGIPYAVSTGGDNRFRAPVALPDTTTPDGSAGRPVSAVAFGQCCPSGQDHPAGIVEGEDCLNLNVYRPHGSDGSGRKLPVAVYVHGGGFNTGLGAERDMASFVAHAADDIVAVNFNYRVGALGFLPCELTARDGLLNLGLRDQQALFAWVKRNIAAFGGDPDNITVMGLSAGAHSVSSVSPGHPPDE